MNSSKHSAFTGSDCEISNEIEGECFMYDGYILATNLELVPSKLIAQSWVAMEDEWPEGHFSTISIELTPKEEGTLITFTHSDVPDALNEALAKGWYEYYWEPLESYFG
jgi:activator of HSP90 ATPase